MNSEAMYINVKLQKQHTKRNIVKQLQSDVANIKKTYNTLNMFSELGIDIHKAGEWILDNLYIIQNEAFSIFADLKNIKFSKLPKANGNIRILQICKEYLEYSHGDISGDKIRVFLEGYEQYEFVTLDEIWTLPVMLKCAVIQYISCLCDEIVYIDTQKYKVERIIEKNILSDCSKKFNIQFKKNDKLQINKPFIEYMAYRLSKLEVNANEYIQILDQEVARLGTTIDEIVSKEHLDIVNKQLLMGNYIVSLKKIGSINFEKELSGISQIDNILSNEKAGIYSKMSAETIRLYQKKIKELSDKYNISEKYICTKIIELCSNQEGKKAHSGYYILSNGANDLYEALGIKKYISEQRKIIQLGIYISIIVSISIIRAILAVYFLDKGTYIWQIIYSLILIIPMSQIVVTVVDKAILKKTKPWVLPAINCKEKIDEENATLVIVPTLLTSTNRVKELISSLETMYLINKQDNIYFALVGDCSEIDEEKIQLDEEIVNIGNEEINKLNSKYNKNIPKFYFTYRKRQFNLSQKKYLGWERKRGLITQLNRYLIYGEQGDFVTINIDREKIGKIKYILTVDADTKLGIDSISKLIGIMIHPLNTPVLNKQENLVIEGHGLVQPRIATSITATKNIFTLLWGGYGGIDIYTNAVSDIYQDVWDEGIFTGKGIYDLEIFSKVLDNQIPENTVLSHDLLEGSFLRAGLATNIEFIDGFPSRYNSYIVRQNRWFRGDIQILRWLKEKVKYKKELIQNPLNPLSKWKIIDNIRRGLLNTTLLFTILFGIGILNISWYWVIGLVVWVYMVSSILDYILNNTKRDNKNYIYRLSNIEISIYRTVLEIAFLPYSAICNIQTIVKTIYRMCISKSHMLEWMTAEQAEHVLGKTLKTYFSNMYISGIVGIVFIIFTYMNQNIANLVCAYILCGLWIASPLIAWWISREKEKVDNILTKTDTQLIYKFALDTWKYFEDNLTKKNNYLIPDNYQEERNEVIAYRTSPTNIGLSLIAVMSAEDLEYISKEQAQEYIFNILQTVENLTKFRGNLYNWYNIKTLEPLNDNISSVDNGNYIAYMYVLKTYCKQVLNNNELVSKIDTQINNMDLRVVYNYEKELFSIEYNVRTGELSKSYYDLLASESRILSYVGIAKGDIPYSHWAKLNRTQTSSYGKKGLISWTGTAFEYFMPYGIMPRYKYSLLDETYYFVYNAQRKYVTTKMPWGISESAFNLYDPEYNYQYKAFGVPSLGLKRGLKEDLVIAPYGSIIMLPMFSKEVINNMKQLKRNGGYGKYGFYDSIDYTRQRIGKKKRKVVRTFMAHHQGLILLSINNYINNLVIQKRFMSNPETKAIELLLQEKTQPYVSIGKTKTDCVYEEKKSPKVQTSEYIAYTQDKILGNLLSNKDYSMYIDNTGKQVSKLKDIYVYRQYNIMLKEQDTNEIVSCLEDPENEYNEYSSTCIKKIEDIEVETKIYLCEDSFGELRDIHIRNMSPTEEKTIELYVYIEPVISNLNDDKSHRSFNNMSLEYEKVGSSIILKRRKRKQTDKHIYAGFTMMADNNANIDFETNRYTFLGRNRSIYNALAIEKGLMLSNKAIDTIEPILVYKITMKIKPQESMHLCNGICVSYNKEECLEAIQKACEYGEIRKELEIARSKSSIESNFYKYDANDIEEYNKIITRLLDTSISIVERKLETDVTQQQLWKYGISGDLPVLTVEISRKIEIFNIVNLLKAYKYIQRKGIKFDLVILVKANEEYINGILKEIADNIYNQGISLDIDNGIYIINEISKELELCLKLISKIYITPTDFNIQPKPKPEKNNNHIIQNIGTRLEYNTEKLLYYNEIGGFDLSTNEYVIILNNGYVTPAPWVHILTNKEFGTMTSENGIVYSWYKNSGQNKLTKWNGDQVSNPPSEYITISEEDRVWGITCYPYSVKDATYIIKYGRGYTTYISNINEIYATQEICVLQNYNIQINSIVLKNQRDENRNITITLNMNLLLGNEIQNKIYNMYVENNYCICKNVFSKDYSNESMYILCSNENVKYKLINEELKAVCNLSFLPNEEKKIEFQIGIKEDEQHNITINKEEIYNTKQYWENVSTKICVRTPVESMNILLNNCLIYQTLTSRLFGKTGFYQTSGAYGFRDQLQDMLSIMYVNPEIARKQIIYHARHQYMEGDVMHWWHEDLKTGIRSRYSDDKLWLIFVTLEYIKITGDKEILEEEVEYIESEILKEDEIDRYEQITNSNVKEPLYNHLIKAIDSVQFSENGLPYIGAGDWSDGLNNVNGVSVWLAFFIYYFLNEFINVVKEKDEKKYIEYVDMLNDISVGLKDTWDGKWYKRAYFSNGDSLGSNENNECKIDSISQSWSVISKYGDIEKRQIAMNSVDDILVDREHKLIKLFAPSFNKDVTEPGYIKTYIPGVRENGGQYTHAAIWSIMAQCILGNGNRAHEYFKMLNPIELTRTNETARKYKGEPYVISADVYSAHGMEGRCGWTYYTGSASWMYKVGIEYILGFKLENNILKIEPCIDETWKEYTIQYKYYDSIYNIKVENANGRQVGITKMYIDGKLQQNNVIILEKESGYHDVICIM